MKKKRELEQGFLITILSIFLLAAILSTVGQNMGASTTGQTISSKSSVVRGFDDTWVQAWSQRSAKIIQNYETAGRKISKGAAEGLLGEVAYANKGGVFIRLTDGRIVFTSSTTINSLNIGDPVRVDYKYNAMTRETELVRITKIK